MTPDFDEQLKKFKYEDRNHNLQVLGEINEYFKENYLLSDIKKESVYIKNLYSNLINEEWFVAQCKAASRQIEKLIDEKSKFHKYYSSILTPQDLITLHKEIIFDISYLARVVNCTGGWCGIDVQRPNYLLSSQYFLHAKFAYFKNKTFPELTHRHFNISTMPTLIRQAIEFKIKNMIGLYKVTDKNGNFKVIPISKLINFFIETNFLSIPIDINYLKYINTWTNTSIHSGLTPFVWQSLEAIDIIEELFSTKHKEAGNLNTHGFSYISEGISLSDLSEALNKKFNAIFHLDEKLIEGEKYYR